jgi:hypothetical protein
MPVATSAENLPAIVVDGVLALVEHAFFSNDFEELPRIGVEQTKRRWQAFKQ